jgi:hypothetical protein
MDQLLITPEEFHSELNLALQQDPEYQEGMEIVPVVTGIEEWDMEGYDLRWPGHVLDEQQKAILLSRALHTVQANYRGS